MQFVCTTQYQYKYTTIFCADEAGGRGITLEGDHKRQRGEKAAGVALEQGQGARWGQD